MDALVRSSLVERELVDEGERFYTFPFITGFAKRLLTPEDLTNFAFKAAAYFGDLCNWAYQSLPSGTAGLGFAAVALEEENIWACLDSSRPIEPKRDEREVPMMDYVATYFANILLFQGRFRDAIRAADLGFPILDSIGDQKGRGNLFQVLSDAKRRLRDKEGARNDYEAAHSIFEELEFELGQANVLYELGNVVAANDPREAQNYYERALGIFGKIVNPVGEANCRRALGDLFTADDKPETALPHLLMALEANVNIPNFVGAANVLHSMARAMGRVQKHKEAVVLRNHALSLRALSPDSAGQALGLFAMARSLFALEQVEAGLAAALQANQLFDNSDHPAASELNSFIDEIASSFEPGQFNDLAQHLHANAEILLKQAVDSINSEVEQDPLLLEVTRIIGPMQERLSEMLDS